MGSGCSGGSVPPGQPQHRPICSNCGNATAFYSPPCYQKAERECSECKSVITTAECRWRCPYGCSRNVCLACGRKNGANKRLDAAIKGCRSGVASTVEELSEALKEANAAGLQIPEVKKAEDLLQFEIKALEEKKKKARGRLELALVSRNLDELVETVVECENVGLDSSVYAEAEKIISEERTKVDAIKALQAAIAAGDLDALEDALGQAQNATLREDHHNVKEARRMCEVLKDEQDRARKKVKKALESLDIDQLNAAHADAIAAKLKSSEIEELNRALAYESGKQGARDAIKEAASSTDVFGLWDDALALATSVGVSGDEMKAARAAANEEVKHMQRLRDAAQDAGIVVFVIKKEKLAKLETKTIAEVSKARRVLKCVSIEAAKQVMKVISDGTLVCFVADPEWGMELAQDIRLSTEVSALLRSIPIVLFTSDTSLRSKAAELGLILEGDVTKLGKRVLSLPSLVAIRSEASAGSFKGNMTAVRFGHFHKHSRDVIFTDNEQVLLSSIARHRLPWYKEVENYDEHIGKLEGYFDALQPVHRCKPGVLLAILREGGLMSRDELEVLLGSSRSAVLRTARHVRLIELSRDPRFAEMSRWVFKYAEAACELELSRKDGRDKAKDKMEKARPRGLSKEDMAYLDQVVSEVVRDVAAQKDSKVGGIGYEKDKILGTTRHVFSTLGPNYGFHYGSVVIILSRDLLYHPGTWCTPLAATGFVGPNFWVFRHRPWGGAALLEKALHGVTSYDVSSDMIPDTPEADAEGVEACLKSALNMAAMEHWPRVMSREVDAMCHYLCFGNRDPYTFDEPFDKARCRQHQKLLVSEDGKMKPDAWKAVVEYYEGKDSHTLYECHLPSFVPLGAIEKVIISSQLYGKHTEIKEKVDTFVMPDGRKLSDLMVITETKEDCIKWQHDYFLKQRQTALKHPGARLPSRPVSVYLAGRSSRPAYLSPDFAHWNAIGGDGKYNGDRAPSKLCISFACRATHDIRVMFSTNAYAQDKDYNLKNPELQNTTYQFCLGMSFNTVSFITRGISGTKHTVHLENDEWARAVSCGTGTEAQMVWERYWFCVEQKPKSAKLQCGRGPVGENVLMEWEDPNPIRYLKYIGLSCWNQPTTYCDLKVC